MDCFYDRVERDELLSPYFPGGVSEEHRAHVRHLSGRPLERGHALEELVDQLVRELAHELDLPLVPVFAIRRNEQVLLAKERAGRRRRMTTPGPTATPAASRHPYLRIPR
jgi:hemoglobin